MLFSRPRGEQYGGSYFQYDINDLLQHYKDFIRDTVQYKVPGTLSYKQEIMHAVLVCSQENGDSLFDGYPPVLTLEEDVNNEAVVT